MFSAVSSSFVIDVQTGLGPDPNDATALYLRAILLTLNDSAVLADLPAPPTPWTGPAQEIIVVTNLLYASLLLSLLAAFVAMLGKQWLNRYLRDIGGSISERCGDRQRKRNGLEKWPFEIFIESLPMMLSRCCYSLLDCRGTCGRSTRRSPVRYSVLPRLVWGFLS